MGRDYVMFSHLCALEMFSIMILNAGSVFRFLCNSAIRWLPRDMSSPSFDGLHFPPFRMVFTVVQLQVLKHLMVDVQGISKRKNTLIITKWHSLVSKNHVLLDSRKYNIHQKVSTFYTPVQMVAIMHQKLVHQPSLTCECDFEDYISHNAFG